MGRLSRRAPAPPPVSPVGPATRRVLRPHDWPERLSAVIRSQEAFQWSEGDCCTFAARAIRAVGGPDLRAEWGATYGDEAAAEREILALGADLGDALARVCQRAGLAECDPNYAMRGDLALLMLFGHQMAAICNGRTFLVPQPRGLMHYPPRLVARLWAV